MCTVQLTDIIIIIKTSGATDERYTVCRLVEQPWGFQTIHFLNIWIANPHCQIMKIGMACLSVLLIKPIILWWHISWFSHSKIRQICRGISRTHLLIYSELFLPPITIEFAIYRSQNVHKREGRAWGPCSGWAYIGECHPKSSKFGTIVHLGSRT